MGSAIIKGLAGTADITLAGYNRSKAPLDSLAADVAGFTACASATELAAMSDYIIIGVKPDQVAGVLDQITPELTPDTVVISIAAGVSQDTLKRHTNAVCPVVRCMPNTPAMVGEGVFALCFDDDRLKEQDKEALTALFGTIGSVLVLEEKKFNAFTVIAGCGPAYVFHFMEAVTEAAVTVGFTRKDATAMVIQLFKGSVKLADESDQHQIVLRESA